MVAVVSSSRRRMAAMTSDLFYAGEIWRRCFVWAMREGVRRRAPENDAGPDGITVEVMAAPVRLDMIHAISSVPTTRAGGIAGSSALT